jgi:phospholipase C
VIEVPACIPDKSGKGPYRPSPVKYVPTIMDSMQVAGRSWGIYAPGKDGSTGYGWAICPTFFECFSTDQRRHVVQPGDFATAAEKGALPSLSIVIPFPGKSQHNSNSLMAGDNWIAKNVAAVMNGPDWSSTAIFITYDDCGCFYDPVRPPQGLGIREPMVIVSPYARSRFVDHTDASFASILAFTEHTFGLPPLPGGADGNAYDYANAFNFAQRPRAPIPLPEHPVPASSLRWLAAHPLMDNDPT